MAGRTGKPMHLHVVEGTFRADRHSPDSMPHYEPGNLQYPNMELNREQAFHMLSGLVAEHGLDCNEYSVNIWLAADCIETIAQCDREIQAHGMLIESRGLVGLKPNPAVKQKQEAKRHLQSLLSEFGLSPVSVRKIESKAPGKSKQNKFAGM